MFEKAIRLKLRFEYRGLLSVEDLWDLSVENLDNIYKALSTKAKSREDSLLETHNREDDILDLRIEIVKHIVAVKLAEQEEREQEVERRARKEKLLEILEEKQDEKLRDLPVKKLQDMIADLD